MNPYAVMVSAKYPKHPVPTSTNTCLHAMMVKALKAYNIIKEVKGLIQLTCSHSGNKISEGNNLGTFSIGEVATGKLLK